MFGLGKTPFWTPSARVVEGEGCRKRGRGSHTRGKDGQQSTNNPLRATNKRRKIPGDKRREAWKKSNSCGHTPWEETSCGRGSRSQASCYVRQTTNRQGSSIIGSRYLELTSLDLWPSRIPPEAPSTNPSMNIPLQALNQRYSLRGILNPRPFVSRMHWGFSYPALRHPVNTNVVLHNPHLSNHLNPPSHQDACYDPLHTFKSKFDIQTRRINILPIPPFTPPSQYATYPSSSLSPSPACLLSPPAASVPRAFSPSPSPPFQSTALVTRLCPAHA